MSLEELEKENEYLKKEIGIWKRTKNILSDKIEEYEDFIINVVDVYVESIEDSLTELKKEVKEILNNIEDLDSYE